MRAVYQYTLVYLLFFVFSSCTHVKIKKQNYYDNIKVFEFLLDDLKGVDIRDKFVCMFPRLVNIELNPRPNFKQLYPNPCCPPSFPPYIIFVNNLDSLKITVTLNDSVLTAVKEKRLRKGYYVFRTNIFLLNEIEQGIRRDLLKHQQTHSVKIIINKNEFVHKLGNNYASTVLCE